jgi:hypothetical protein
MPADHGALICPISNMVPVRTLLDPQRRGRQFMAARLVQLAGTRAGGFVLRRQGAAGKWGTATYFLVRT